VEGEVDQVVNNHLFRDAQGNPVHPLTSGLELALKDFAVQEIANNVPDASILIDSETLCRLLAEAEDEDQQATAMQGAKPWPFKRKWREKTPPEELRSSDEEKFKEAERRVRKKTQMLDRPYGGEKAPVEGSSQGSV